MPLCVSSILTLCVLNVDIQNPLCAFHTFTVVSDDADITENNQTQQISLLYSKVQIIYEPAHDQSSNIKDM